MRLTKSPSVAVDLKQDVDRFMDRLLGGPFFPGAELAEAVWSPALDFSETEKEYVIRIEVPGIPRENLDVHLEGQMLTISGHRETRKEGEGEASFWREREAGRFVRSLRLPLPVEGAKVEAINQDGLLTVRLPKSEVKPKNRITIK